MTLKLYFFPSRTSDLGADSFIASLGFAEGCEVDSWCLTVSACWRCCISQSDLTRELFFPAVNLLQGLQNRLRKECSFGYFPALSTSSAKQLFRPPYPCQGESPPKFEHLNKFFSSIIFNHFGYVTVFNRCLTCWVFFFKEDFEVHRSKFLSLQLEIRVKTDL